MTKPVLDTFNKLPAPMQSTIVLAAGVGAAALVAVPKIIAFKAALASWGPAGVTATRGIKGMGKAMAVLAAGEIAGAAIRSFSNETINAGRSTKKLQAELLAWSRGPGSLDDLGQAFDNGIGLSKSFNEALGEVRDNHWWDNLPQAVSGVFGVDSSMGLAKKSVAGFDDALAGLVNDGNLVAASKFVERFGLSSDEVTRILPAYADALDKAGDANVATGTKVKGLTTKADLQKRAVDALKSSWDLLSGLLDKRAAKRNWLDSMSEITAKVKEAGGKFNESTSKGREFQDWLDTNVGPATLEDPRRR